MAEEFDPSAVRKPGNKGGKPSGKPIGTQTGRSAIRALWASDRRQAEEDRLPDDPPPDQPREFDGQIIKPGQWEGAPHDRLPPGCPVHVIGQDADGAVHCITASGRWKKVEKWDMPTLAQLFAPQINYLFWAWPGFGKKKVPNPDGEPGDMMEVLKVNRVERDKAMTAIINQAAKRPDFDPDKQHRGRGGWADKSGAFLWHSGAWLWRATPAGLERARPAEHDGFLYTRAAGTIEPWEQPIKDGESPALRLLEDLRSWKWERPYLDPVLVLGWIATAMMGAALKARPIVFTTGGFGVGKSTLHELINTVLDGVVTPSVNTTAAGIYQTAKHDSLPFIVDELESKPGSSRAESVIELARVAYTGGDISRGGADHSSTRFVARNSFLFSAINPPPMGTQDKTRMALLNLRRLDQSDGIGRKVSVAIDQDGPMLLRQVMDGWHDFSTRLLQTWWDALAAQKLDSRSIDTYGTLLAAAELLVGPAVLEEIGLPVTEHTKLGEIVAAATATERSEQLDNWHRCLNHLLDSTIEAWRDGVKPTIGGVMDRLTWSISEHGGLGYDEGRERLALVNLGLKKPEDGSGWLLAVPKDGPMLKRIFAGEIWHDGVWFDALKQAPETIVWRNAGSRQKVRINGVVRHCLLVDMAAFAKYADSEA